MIVGSSCSGVAFACVTKFAQSFDIPLSELKIVATTPNGAAQKLVKNEDAAIKRPIVADIPEILFLVAERADIPDFQIPEFTLREDEDVVVQ